MMRALADTVIAQIPAKVRNDVVPAHKTETRKIMSSACNVEIAKQTKLKLF
jgi:hypothetical protein